MASGLSRKAGRAPCIHLVGAEGKVVIACQGDALMPEALPLPFIRGGDPTARFVKCCFSLLAQINFSICVLIKERSI